MTDSYPTPNQALVSTLLQADVTPHAKKVLGMSNVRSGVITHERQEWFICRAPQDAGCARLLDVAVAVRAERQVPCLAVLEAPADAKRKMEADQQYLASYQGIAWHGLDVAFVLDDGKRAFAPANGVVPTDAARAAFTPLADSIEIALETDAKTLVAGARWMLPEDSREAEAMVRLTLSRVLHPRGYRRYAEDPAAMPKTYAGFWRRAEADGMWSNPGAPVQQLALESKLNEDIEAPLCQVVDHLAHASMGGCGAVIYVRVRRSGPKKADVDVAKVHVPSSVLDQLQHRMLVRYLDVVLDQ